MGSLATGGSTLYGTAAEGGGGTPGNGTLFSIGPDGSAFKLIYRFGSFAPYGYEPISGLVVDGNAIYGTTYSSYGAYGTVYVTDIQGASYSVVKLFMNTDGSGPDNLLLVGSTLFGTTRAGGNYDSGVLFVCKSGFSILHHFTTMDASPRGPLVLLGDRLYGTLARGAPGTAGGIFTIQTNGNGYSVLKRFTASDGASPEAGLVTDGTALYGTTSYSGVTNSSIYGYGTVFKMNTNGSGYSILKQFSGPDGCFPQCSLLLSGSRLYGTTTYGGVDIVGGLSGSGTLFKINTDGSGFIVLHQFAGTNGAQPIAGPVILNNTLYGTTVNGGASSHGTIFGLALPDAPKIMIAPSEQVAVPGGSARFGVDALGVEPLAYQWTENGTNLGAAGMTATLTISNVQKSGQYAVFITNAFGAVTSAPVALRLIDPSIVTNCSETDLRVAMAQGGNITLAFEGPVVLTSGVMVHTNTALTATGHNVTIQGSNGIRLFWVATNVNFGLTNLTLARGNASDGAAIYNSGASVWLSGVSLNSNVSVVAGGAIRQVGGTLYATNCSFFANRVFGPASPAWGGAICSDGGTMTRQNCLFRENLVQAGASTGSGSDTNGLEACGGAIYNRGLLKGVACSFVQNAAWGGVGANGYGQGMLGWFSDPGDTGGVARGGGICNLGSMTLEQSVIGGNSAVGGTGGTGAAGGFGPFMGGWGGRGGTAVGGLFSTGQCILVNCTVAANEAIGGSGGQGGAGGYYPDMGTGQTIYMAGGLGGDGGAAQGEILAWPDQLNATNCTFAFNLNSGGGGGTGGLAGGWGTPNTPGGNGAAFGAFLATNAVLVNSLLGGNAPSNCSVQVVDAGWNISSDSSCGFTLGTSRNNLDPMLAALAGLTDNGGSTLTVALLPGSPAIDHASTAPAPVVDQRGFPRPVGMGPDIGAFEFGSPALLSAARTGQQLRLAVLSVPARTCYLLTSTNLSLWTAVATNVIGNDGTTLFQDTVQAGRQKFYKAELP